jgi:capping protein beta
MPQHRYYEGGLSSVYLWDLDDGGFAGVVLLKKSTFPPVSSPSLPLCLTWPAAVTPASPTEPAGAWDSIHVFEASERTRQAHYKLTSTVMLQLVRRKTGGAADEGWKHDGETSLSGSMTRQVRARHPPVSFSRSGI